MAEPYRRIFYVHNDTIHNNIAIQVKHTFIAAWLWERTARRDKHLPNNYNNPTCTEYFYPCILHCS